MENIVNVDKREVELFESVLRHLFHWSELVFSEGIYTLVVGNMEFHVFDMLNGSQTLFPRELESVKIVVLEGYSIIEADQLLHYIKPSISCKVYSESGLLKLYKYQKSHGGFSIR